MSFRLAIPIFLLFFNGARVSAAENPLTLYGDEIRFDIQRAGQVIGSHAVTFRPTQDGIEARSEVRIAVDFFIFPAFRYRYDSHGYWQDGRLRGLAVDVNDNGRRDRLRLQSHSDGLTGEHNGVPISVQEFVHPTEHWDVSVINQSRVLNTITGKINNVTITRVGEDEVPTERGPVRAAHFRYSGDLDAEVWYDAEGRWVKLRFKGRDGSMIEYTCRRCQGPQAAV